MVVLFGDDVRRWLLGLALAWLLRRLRPPATDATVASFGPWTWTLGALVYLVVVAVTVMRGRPLRASA